ncbi:MAG: hypothetical protein CVT82_11130 [Alphaproteobacteria bacterium HGW-Alphaproteobacteria-4]|nr:MAG: hypothetical protein CVT82_11130 [Alphaproteobacteria bacterium HGW-Alphaproteobacteria-4]
MTLRSWATPMVIGAFLVMAVSGVLMFFHLGGGLNTFAHEWAGWALVVGGIAHLMLNWRPFTSYPKRPLAAGIIGVFAVILGLSFIPLGGSEEGRGGDLRLVMGAMGNARVATLAELSGQTPEAVIAALAEQGIAGAGTDDTVTSLSGGSRERQGLILSAAFAGMRTSE